MPTALTKAAKGGAGANEITSAHERLLRELERVKSRLSQLEEAVGLGRAESNADATADSAPPARPSPLDQLKEVLAATADLRAANGNLSADRVAKLFGVSLSRLASWLGRSKQAVSKTPDADSLQAALGYFERVARLRLILSSDAEFRKWLRTPHELLDDAPPLELIAKGEWQTLTDYVEDALTGAPT